MDFSTNFCGPWWSDGKFQTSKCPRDAKPVNDFDRSCAIHDCAIYNSKNFFDILEADNKFFKFNKGKSLKRTFAAYMVKLINPAFNYHVPYTGGGGILGPLAIDYYTPPTKEDVPVVNKSSDYAEWVRSQMANDTPVMLPTVHEATSNNNGVCDIIPSENYSTYQVINPPQGFRIKNKRRKSYRQRRRRALRNKNTKLV